MKTTLIIAAAAGAMAQNLSGIPSCALPCISTAVTQAGCQATDVACQCGPTQTAIQSLAQGCVLSACPATALVDVLNGGNALCSQYSATRGASASLTTSTGTATATLSNESTTMTMTGTTTGTMTSSHSGHSNGTLSITPTPSGTTTGTTTSAGTTKSSTTSSTTSSSTNAAATPVMLGAGALVGILGFVAAL